jgi:hypothetical protein
LKKVPTFAGFMIANSEAFGQNAMLVLVLCVAEQDPQTMLDLSKKIDAWWKP